MLGNNLEVMHENDQHMLAPGEEGRNLSHYVEKVCTANFNDIIAMYLLKCVSNK